jgi:transcriptional regulator with XRE-family HTH domain
LSRDDIFISDSRQEAVEGTATISSDSLAIRSYSILFTESFAEGGNVNVIIGDRLREMREAKKLSQGDIEKRTGLLRCYISRVENGHTVPAIETLEKLARALEVPLYQLFYDGEEPPKLPNLLKRKSSDDIAWGSAGKDARFLSKLRRLLSKTEEGDRKLLLYMAQKMALPRRG